jgi:hypothetical protein
MPSRCICVATEYNPNVLMKSNSVGQRSLAASDLFARSTLLSDRSGDGFACPGAFGTLCKRSDLHVSTL